MSRLASSLLLVMSRVSFAVGHEVAEGVQQSRRLRILDAVGQDHLDRVVEASGLHLGRSRGTGSGGIRGHAGGVLARLLTVRRVSARLLLGVLLGVLALGAFLLVRGALVVGLLLVRGALVVGLLLV